MVSLKKNRKICFKFLWFVSLEQQDLAWISWKILAQPKVCGGWGLKLPAIFSKALAAKGVWRVLKGDELWIKVVQEKY